MTKRTRELKVSQSTCLYVIVVYTLLLLLFTDTPQKKQHMQDMESTTHTTEKNAPPVQKKMSFLCAGSFGSE